MCLWSSRTLPAKQFILPRQMCGPDSRSQRGAQSRALARAGQGVGRSPRKGGPQAYHRGMTETPYGAATTGWRIGTAQGVAVGTGPEI